MSGGAGENAPRVRRIEREDGNFRLENIALLVHHPIGPGHDARRRRHSGSRRVAKCFARLQNRLFADHARAFHFLELAVAVGDLPVPGGELHGHIALVGDFHGVSPPERGFVGVGTLGHEFWKNSDLDVVSDGAVHGRDLKWQEAGKTRRNYSSTTLYARKSAGPMPGAGGRRSALPIGKRWVSRGRDKKGLVPN